MSMQKMTIWFVLITFSLLCAWAVAQQGYLAVWTVPLEQPVTTAVGVDLMIVLVFSCLWMIRNAARTQRKVWPYIVLTATCGSVGLLLYLALAKEPQTDSSTACRAGT